MILLLLFLCLSMPSFAAEKVYTNSDLRPPAPTLHRNSRIDPATGKLINDGKSASRSQGESWHGKVAGIALQAKRLVERALDGIMDNTIALAAVAGFLFVIWMACVADILRNEFRGNNKLIWFIAVTFVPLIGWILYLFIGTRQRKYRMIRDYEQPGP